MRVLFWTEGFWPQIGGAEVWGARFTAALGALGHEVVVVTGGGDPGGLPATDTWAGLPVRRFPWYTALVAPGSARIFDVCAAVSELKRSFRPDLIHMSSLGLGSVFHLWSRGASSAPLLVTLHGWASGPGEIASVTRQVLHRADFVVTVSEAVREDTRTVVPVHANRSAVVYNGMVPPPVVPTPLPFAPPRLLCAGRLSSEKGFEFAIDALALLRARHPTLRLLVIGDGPARELLATRAAERGIADAVEFLGWCMPDAVPSAINEATVVVVPSRSEAFSLTALEAANMARPVVASRVGGLPEVVVDGETGCLVPPGDAPGIVAAVDALLRDPGRAVAMGKRARARAMTTFSWDGMMDAYLHRYRALHAAARVA